MKINEKILCNVKAKLTEIIEKNEGITQRAWDIVSYLGTIDSFEQNNQLSEIFDIASDLERDNFADSDKQQQQQMWNRVVYLVKLLRYKKY